jgi:hypothetical protein
LLLLEPAPPQAVNNPAITTSGELKLFIAD